MNNNNNDYGEGIVVYCNSGNVMFTSTGEIIENKKPLRKNRKNKFILYPVFTEMIQYCDCNFWKTNLTKFSKNIFPRNYKFVKGIIYYKAKTKRSKDDFYIDENNIQECFLGMKEFFKKKGFLPTEEVDNVDFSFQENVMLTCWKDFGKNQSNLVYNYINELDKTYILSKREVKNAESTIKIGIAGDIFNNDTIEIFDFKIVNIKYLEWDENKRKFYIDILNSPAKLKFSEKNKKPKRNTSTYTNINSTSSDKIISFKNDFESLDLEKRWSKFLTLFYK